MTKSFEIKYLEKALKVMREDLGWRQSRQFSQKSQPKNLRQQWCESLFGHAASEDIGLAQVPGTSAEQIWGRSTTGPTALDKAIKAFRLYSDPLSAVHTKSA